MGKGRDGCVPGHCTLSSSLYYWQGCAIATAQVTSTITASSKRSGGTTTFSLYEEVDRWTVSGNLANYARLQRIRGLTLPVIVNLHFIGFNNFGNELMDLSSEQFEPWFGHVDHKVPHLVAPVGEEQTTVGKAPTRDSPVSYGFHLNLIKTAPLFDTILQDTILWNMRSERNVEDDDGEGAAAYLDDEDLEELDDVLFFGHRKDAEKSQKKRYYVDANHVSSLLAASATSLGLDSAYNLYFLNPNTPLPPGEIYGYRKGFCKAEIDELRKMAAHPKTRDLFEGMTDDVDIVPCESEPLPPLPLILLPRSGDQTLQILDYTKASAQWASWYVGEVMGKKKSQHKAESEDDASLLFSFSTGEPETTLELAQEIMRTGNEFEQDYLARLLVSTGKETEEDCLVDSWVSTGRSAFLDFTAGPFKWGPLVAGEGVRTYDTVGRVPKYGSHKHRQEEEEHMGEHEEEVAALQARLVKGQLQYTQFECAVKATADCIILKQRLDEMSDQLAELVGTAKGADNVAEAFQGTAHEGEGMDAVMDSFLSRTSALISKTLRHLVVPAAPLKEVQYAPKVVFQLFLLTAQEDYAPRAPEAFEFDEFKHQMLQFALPSQTFSFTVTKMALADLPGVATAFQASIRTAAIPSLSPQGEYYTVEQEYVDSMTLRDKLTAERTFADLGREESGLIRHVPIFFFSISTPVPVLIDRYYQAKALDDAVIVVQNAQMQYPSRLACNGNIIHLNLRNPLKPMLASTALFLGGVIPTHISYDPAHQSATQDWLWSVGDNPLSRTSHGTTFNRFQIDTAQRNMVVSSLERSIALVNEGIDILEGIHIGPNNKLVQDMLPIEMVQWFYTATGNAWTETASAVAVLHFDLAVSHMLAAEDAAYQFNYICRELAITMEAFQCLPYAIQETDSSSQMLLIIPVLFFLFDIV
eukprot:CAMPEP_0114619546 /NCGR_PEP_ID=MMETSP0168-20121206/8268_1 /TAXON_ID=95228 ORGANISM="Vannella sp., Strain DIVA3 517/6/12" /NCGR_SAMPLE_ID=MMETSP0168 /ASSEMBLY_ACC=CAM_ASM_000044 /LENGTH=924 /DNA_ID=CAMNT_0001830715 /DNA_START=34 /DNA_END=2805 /DNA_ORIENTATION=+